MDYNQIGGRSQGDGGIRVSKKPGDKRKGEFAEDQRKWKIVLPFLGVCFEWEGEGGQAITQRPLFYLITAR